MSLERSRFVVKLVKHVKNMMRYFSRRLYQHSFEVEPTDMSIGQYGFVTYNIYDKRSGDVVYEEFLEKIAGNYSADQVFTASRILRVPVWFDGEPIYKAEYEALIRGTWSYKDKYPRPRVRRR